MEDLTNEINSLGYDLAGLLQVEFVPMSRIRSAECEGGSCNGGCSNGCSSCKPNCNTGSK